MQALSNMHKALVGRRLNPQKPQSPPYFGERCLTQALCMRTYCMQGAPEHYQ
jgi:hypothetical protein